MSKLNLLIPDYKMKYFDDGKGGKAKYLNIPQHFTRKDMLSDIKAGATQFKECLDMFDKGLSRVVLIACASEEDGYMAATYMAALENERLGLNSVVSDDLLDKYCGFRECKERKEFKDIGSNGYFFEDYDDEDNLKESVEGGWVEDPYRMPIIKVNELKGYNAPTPFFSSPLNEAQINVKEPTIPYWHRCVHEPVCLLLSQMDRSMGFDLISRNMDIFSDNRNVYVVVQDIGLNAEYENMDRYGMPFGIYNDDTVVCTFVLENTADFLQIKVNEEQLKEYRITQFENWLDRLELKLEKNFPKRTYVNRIVKINKASKSELISLVLKYVKLNKKDCDNVLTKDDFKILTKFKSLGVELSASDATKSSDRLENELIGMNRVKQQVREIVALMNYNRTRDEMGFGKSNFHNVHLLIGAPGTAKTTVAKLMGNMMCEQKLIKGNRFISVNGADLKGMYVGHSAPKTKALFEDYDIILIDEAYSLMTEGKGSDSFSQEAMAQLIIEIEEHAMDKLVFFAGYGGLGVSEKDNRMKQFIDGNPGLKSRINSTIYFESYTPDEMVDILHCQAKTFKFKLDKSVDGIVRDFFSRRVKDENFGNGREARSLLENATIFAASRVMQLPESKRTKKAFETIAYEDVKNAIDRMESSNILQTGRKDRVVGFMGA